jgi:hypothetical protein
MSERKNTEHGRGSVKSRVHRRCSQLPDLRCGVVLLLLSSSLQSISGGVSSSVNCYSLS